MNNWDNCSTHVPREWQDKILHGAAPSERNTYRFWGKTQFALPLTAKQKSLMLDTDTKRRIDTARDILVGKVPDPKSQVEQITIALIYKFMDDMDAEAEEFGGKRKFFAKKFAKYG